jgi:hypothetical protein
MIPIMSVVNLDDYRAPNTTGPFTITFIGFNFTTPEGRQDRLTVNLTGEQVNPLEIIASVREQGGLYLPPQNGEEFCWFLPWLCAAVRISPART